MDLNAPHLTVAALAENIRRNVKHMHNCLEVGDERDSRLFDFLGQLDDLAEQIEIAVRSN